MAKEGAPQGELPSATDIRGFKMSRTGTAIGLGGPAPSTKAGGAPKGETVDMAIEEVLREFDARPNDAPVVVTRSTDGHRAAAYQAAHSVHSGQDTLPPEQAVIVDVPTDPIARPRFRDAPTEPPAIASRARRSRLVVVGVCGVALVILILAIGRWATTGASEHAADSPAASATVPSAKPLPSANAAARIPSADPSPPPPAPIASAIPVTPSIQASATPPRAASARGAAPATSNTSTPSPRASAPDDRGLFRNELKE